jgi:hypothetical protein
MKKTKTVRELILIKVFTFYGRNGNNLHKCGNKNSKISILAAPTPLSSGEGLGVWLIK